jgi:hypothetical protein
MGRSELCAALKYLLDLHLFADFGLVHSTVPFSNAIYPVFGHFQLQLGAAMGAEKSLLFCLYVR